MDETFTFSSARQGTSESASFDGGAGNDTLDATFAVVGFATGGLTTIFTDNGDGTFSATYSRPDGSGSDSVTITNVENVFISIAGDGGGINGTDFVRTGDGNDNIFTDDANDIIDSGRGVDIVDGGAGAEDVISKDFSDVSVDILWNIRTGAFTGPGSFVNLESFGTLRTGAGNDVIVTSDFSRASDNPSDEIIFTGAGSDLVTVSNGIDHVDMGGGDDRLIADYTNAFFPGSIVSILNQNPDGSYSGEHRGVASGGTRTGVTFDGVEHFTLIYPVSGGNGGNLNDTIHTGDGNDVVHAGASSDRIHVGRGIDEVDGGETGTDVDGLAKEFEAAGPAIDINLDANTYSGPGLITNIEFFIDLKTSDGNDVVVTSNIVDNNNDGGDDLIDTRGGDDVVTLFNGNDVVDLGAGNDRLIIDLATYNAFVAGTTMTLVETSPGTYSGLLDTASSNVDVTFAGVEHFTFHGNSTGGNGSNSRDDITTGDGDDIIFTYHSNDTIDAGGGNDVIDGGSANDVIDGGAGDDYIDGGTQNDTMRGGLGDDVFIVDTAADSVVEQAGEGVDEIRTTLASFSLASLANVENLTGIGAAGQTLTGNGGANALDGGAGDDSLDGGGGADTMTGGTGNDTFYVEQAGDLVVESAGGGSDTVVTSVSYTLGAGQEIELLRTFGSSTTYAADLTGNEFAQSLVGNAAGNRLDGAGGADAMYGFGGDDTYLVDHAGDLVVEAAGGGSDTVIANTSYALRNGQEVELLRTFGTSTTNAVDLTGNGFAQTIVGNAAANRIDGKGGADTLYGFGGDDQFAFTTALGGGNVDRIVDFQPGADEILLDDAVFAGLGLGALDPAAFRTGSAAQDADDRIIYNSATGALFFDADGVGGAAAVQFAALDPGLPLAASDFTVI